MDGLDTALEDCRRRRDSFVWEVPKSFNFARDVVDRFAVDPNRPATSRQNGSRALSRSGWCHDRRSRCRAGRTMGMLHTIFAQVARLGVIESNPALNVRKLGTDNRRDRHLSQDEIETLGLVMRQKNRGESDSARCDKAFAPDGIASAGGAWP